MGLLMRTGATRPSMLVVCFSMSLMISLKARRFPQGSITLFLYLLKKRLDGDASLVARSLDQTRCISLSDTTPKIIAKSIACILDENLSECLEPNHCAVKGTQFVDNIFGVVSAMLPSAAQPHAGSISVL